MDGTQIRRILIEYLKASHEEIRIYQEKSIGVSTCDLMAVTDCLVGYEIKSDRDNYQRLSSQVDAYEKFFDKSYIVVGNSHKNTVAIHIPDNWGIVCIDEESVKVVREAKRLDADGSLFSAQRAKAQLGLLWKLELSNLLTKEGMPPYTYKIKNYIIDKITERLDDKTIRDHVVYELMHRDYSVYGAKDRTIYQNGRVSDNQATILNDDKSYTWSAVEEMIDALSEKDPEVFTLDKWIEIFRKAGEAREAKQQHVSKIVRKPHAITYKDIEVSLGAPWIDEKIIKEFAEYLCFGSVDDARRQSLKVNYENVTGNWFIPRKN